MTRALAVALGLMVALAAAPAHAVQIIGAGLAPCGTWTADRAARDIGASEGETWVGGYLSGAAFWGSNLDPMKGIDAKAAWAWVEDYCRAHPLDKIIDAANAFIQEHPGR
jgi:hypothetical protein